MKTLNLEYPIDNHLKPVKDFDNNSTSLELSSTKMRVKDFEVTGTATGIIHAGMIIGYTVIGLNETPSRYDVLNSMQTVHDDLKVTFIAPPSGNVEIMASIYIDTDSGRPLTFGLSTTDATSGFTTLGAKYENHTFMGDETDGSQHEHRWYVSGLTSGVRYTYWFAAGCTQTTRYDLYWGGDSSAVGDTSEPYEYQPFVMKVTALPDTIYTG